MDNMLSRTETTSYLQIALHLIGGKNFSERELVSLWNKFVGIENSAPLLHLIGKDI